MGAEASFRSGSDERLKLPDGLADGIREMHERWNNRVLWKNLNLAKSYGEGRLAVLIELDGVSEVYGTPSDRPAERAEEVGTAHFPEYRTVWTYQLDIGRGASGDGRDDDRVLVYDVEPGNRKEVMAYPAIVSREANEEFLRIVSGCYYSITRGFVINNTATMGQKLGVPVLCTAVQPHQFPLRVVKRHTEVVDGIAQNQRDIGWQLRCVADSGHFGGCIGIFLGAKDVRIEIGVGPESGIKVRDVLFGPF